MKELNINGFREQIIERSDYPIEKCRNMEKTNIERLRKIEKQ